MRTLYIIWSNVSYRRHGFCFVFYTKWIWINPCTAIHSKFSVHFVDSIFCIAFQTDRDTSNKIKIISKVLYLSQSEVVASICYHSIGTNDIQLWLNAKYSSSLWYIKVQYNIVTTQAGCELIYEKSNSSNSHYYFAKRVEFTPHCGKIATRHYLSLVTTLNDHHRTIS